jgi:hypothetical protein
MRLAVFATVIGRLGRVSLLGMFGLLGCAGSRNPNQQYLTVRTAGTSNQLALASNGGISGPRMQLAVTQNGYRGIADDQMVDLRSNGEHIQGTIHERVVDLHVSIPDEGGVRARGMFGGMLGRLEATPLAIVSSLGFCHYELYAIGQRYEGQRACGPSGRMPLVRPAIIELPAGFERLPRDRQAMLLAVLLGD